MNMKLLTFILGKISISPEKNVDVRRKGSTVSSVVFESF
jgi:hypothetical protein